MIREMINRIRGGSVYADNRDLICEAITGAAPGTDITVYSIDGTARLICEIKGPRDNSYLFSPKLGARLRFTDWADPAKADWTQETRITVS